MNEVRNRALDKFVIENTDEETVVHLTKTRGMKPLYDARPVELLHEELRRQMCGNWDFDKYHHNEKKELCHMLPMK